jgi:hypothetical protein
MAGEWRPPAGADPAVEPAPRGRIRRGIWLTRKTWSLLSGRRELWALPIASALALVLAAVLLFAPVAVLAGDGGSTGLLVAAVVVAAFVLTFISTFFNVAFLVMVDAHIDGREVTAREAIGVARGRIGAILGWSLLATVVGIALRALENVNGGELVARLIGGLGGLAWSLASFFAVPVLALEDVGPIEALKRSVNAFKRRWGEQVAGDFVIAAVYMIALAALLAVTLFGFAAAVRAPVVGVPVLAAGLAGMAACIVVSSAVSRVFSLVVYRHATERPLPTPFTEADVAATFRPKRSWLRRLAG